MPSNTAIIPMATTLSCADAALLIINRPTIAPKIYAAPVLGTLNPKIKFLITSKRINKTKISIISVADIPIDCDAKANAKITAIAAYSKIGATNPSKKPSINAGGINCAFIYIPQKICSKQSVNFFLSNPSERGNPAPMLNARLPQKMPSASPGQARCLFNTAITQGEPSPKARRAFPLTQKRSLDHDHATGEPRGLLHQACNMKVAQIETHTKKLNYIISRLTLTELALQFRKKHYQLLCAVLSYTEGLLVLRCLSWL